MKNLLLEYRSVIAFILTFLIMYGVLTFVYKIYLDLSEDSPYYPDYFTSLVAKQSDALLQTFGYTSEIKNHPDEPSVKLFLNGTYVARIFEGCNSLSIIILFISFVVAFSGQLKTTFLYVLAGSVLIYVVNLLRIVVLSVGLYRYPWREEVLHAVIFPLIIYGMVFLLWMLWVNRFSKLRRAHE